MINFVLYLIRWQLSSPILALVVAYVKGSPNIFGTAEDWYAVAIANLIGSCIFFWVDRFIFKSKTIERWEVIEGGRCHDCGKFGIVRRLVETDGYNKRNDPKPEFRCNACSKQKLKELKERKAIN